MLTIPTIGWVAKLGANRSKLASFSIAKYGAQTGNDWQWFPDAGNGVRTNGQNVTGNDPNDANVPSNSTFQQGWVQHLVSTLGHERERRPALLHPRQRAQHLALDPSRRPPDRRRPWTRSATRCSTTPARSRRSIPPRWSSGPEEWGWSGYFYSGYDQQYGGAARLELPARPRTVTAARTTCPGCSTTLRQNNTATGVRLLDVFTVHYYPQGGEFSDDVSSAMQLRRNRSTRSLWDPDLRR